MKTMYAPNPRFRKSALLFSLAAVLAFCLFCPASLYAGKGGKGGGGSTGGGDTGGGDTGGGTTSTTVVRVEEDWELVVLEPDPDSSGPQINCVIAPLANADGTHATLELNHHSLSGNEEGGMQMQVWDGETRVGPAKIVTASTLSNYGETVTWTQSMKVSDTGLIFEVLDGSAATWTSFGTDTTATTDSSTGGVLISGTGGTTTTTTTIDYQVLDYATLSDGSLDSRTLTTDDPLYSAVSTTLTNLNTYNPQVSVDESGVTYGANLVTSLKIVQVRKYMSDGTVQTDSTSRVVYQNNN